mgnify:CR=1 FL=1
MLVQTASYQYAPHRVLPFILRIRADYPYNLVCSPVVTPHIVSEIILIILKADCKVCRHEDTFLCLVYILGSTYPCKVGSLSICIRVLACAVIAFPADVLHRYEGVQTMLLIL